MLTQSHVINRNAGHKLCALLSASVLACGLTFAGSALAKDTIALGFIGPLTGANGLQGLGARNGFQLAIDQVPDDFPYTVKGLAEDDASKSQVGVHAAMKLVNDPDMVALTCCWNSPVALAIMPVVKRANIPLVVWGAISPKITDQNFAQVTRTAPTLTQENGPMAEWLVQDLGFKRIAILSTTDDYGENNIESFTAAAEALGADIVATEALPPDETNYKSVLTKIKNAKPDAVYFGGVIGPAALARKQMISIGLDVPMAGISGIFDPKFIEIAGKAADGTLAAEPIVEDNPALHAFNEDYAAAGFKEEQGPYAKYAYDATNVILDAIAETGTDDKDALIEAIRNIEYEGIVGTVTFDENGQTAAPLATVHYRVEDGAWVRYDDE